MKLKYGDMLIMHVENGTLSLQLIGRNDVPRVEKEGYGWSDGATALLKGADVAEFLDALSGCAGEYEIGNSGLSMKFEMKFKRDDDIGGFFGVVLSAEGVSARLAWTERTLLLYAVQGLAWRLFQ